LHPTHRYRLNPSASGSHKLGQQMVGQEIRLCARLIHIRNSQLKPGKLGIEKQQIQTTGYANPPAAIDELVYDRDKESITKMKLDYLRENRVELLSKFE